MLATDKPYVWASRFWLKTLSLLKSHFALSISRSDIAYESIKNEMDLQQADASSGASSFVHLSDAQAAAQAEVVDSSQQQHQTPTEPIPLPYSAMQFGQFQQAGSMPANPGPMPGGFHPPSQPYFTEALGLQPVSGQVHVSQVGGVTPQHGATSQEVAANAAASMGGLAAPTSGPSFAQSQAYRAYAPGVALGQQQYAQPPAGWPRPAYAQEQFSQSQVPFLQKFTHHLTPAQRAAAPPALVQAQAPPVSATVKLLSVVAERVSDPTRSECRRRR